jgi:hypothetical protein
VSDIPEIVSANNEASAPSLRQSQAIKRRASKVFPGTGSARRQLSSTVEMSKDLLTWVNLHLKNFQKLTVDIATDFQNGDNYLMLLHVISGAKCGLQTLPDLSKLSDKEKAAMVVEAAKKLGVSVTITVEDILTVSSKFTCFLFRKYSHV